MNNKEKQEFIEGLISGIDKASETKRGRMYMYTLQFQINKLKILRNIPLRVGKLIKNLKLKQDYD